MELVLQHQKLNKMETYKVFIDYVEGPGEVEGIVLTSPSPTTLYHTRINFT